MATFKAIVTEDIPANRLLNKTSGEDGIEIAVAKDGDTPEFRSTGELTAGQEVTVNVLDSPIWKVEAGADIKAGEQVKVGTDGTVVPAAEDTGLGYATAAVSKGDLASIVWGAGGSGGSVGPGTVGTDDLEDEAVTHQKLGVNAVLNKNIGDGSVQNRNIGTGSVQENNIGAKAVPLDKLGDDVTSLLDKKLTASQAAAQDDSTASDVEGLVADLNALLAKLKTAKIMAS
ncbi:head fiber protein [Bacillus sp. JZ34]